MDLKNLLDEQNWEYSLAELKENEIDAAMKAKVSYNVRQLFQTYYLALGLNVIFMILALLVYFYNPRLEVLIPVLIILSSFLIIVANILWQFWKSSPIDSSSDVRSVLEESLSFNHELHNRLKSYNQMIMLSAFTGGFFLGLAIQGWDLEKVLNKPIIIPVFLLLLLGFYFIVKSKKMNYINRILNPRYQRIKSSLENQLKMLEAIS